MPIRRAGRARARVRCCLALKRRQLLARGVSPWEPIARADKPRRGDRTVDRTVAPPGLVGPRNVPDSQGLAPLANDFRPVPGLGDTRLNAKPFSNGRCKTVGKCGVQQAVR